MNFPRRKLYAAIAIALAASFLLCGYEFIRAVSTSLFIAAYGSKNLPRVMVAVPPGVFFLLYLYGRLLSWLGPKRALSFTSLLSAALMAAAYVLLIREVDFASAVIYVFREAYIVLIIEQYWSLVNSTLEPEQARWFNGPFCAIASLGSISGGTLVSRLAEPLGSEVLLLFAAGSLVPAAVCGALAYTFAGEPQPSLEEKGGKQGHTGLRVLARSRYLALIFCLILTTQVVSTTLDLRFNSLVENSIPDKDARTAYYGTFYGPWLGVSAFVLQLSAGLVMRIIPFRILHLSIPFVHLISSAALTIAPSLQTGALAFLLFKALDYSLFRAAKEILYIPLSYDARYRAKQVIDSFGYRFAKGGGAGVITLIGLIVAIPGAAFSVTAMAMALIWTGIASQLSKQYQKLERD
jgi:AAA family ATP:ADP antiporter